MGQEFDPRLAGSLSDNAAAGDDHHPHRGRPDRQTRRVGHSSLCAAGLSGCGVALFTAHSSLWTGDHGNRTLAELARRLCPHCKAPIDIPTEALIEAGFSEADLDGNWTPYRPVGCDLCKGTGYKGRVGIYQVMPVTEEIQRMIMANATSLDIANQARREGVNDLRRSGLLKVKQGLTSLEEVFGSTNV